MCGKLPHWSGYQGSDYLDPLLNIAVCYQVGLGINDSNTSQWGAKGHATAVVNGANHNVTIQTGSGFTTNANGTLYLMIAAGGSVSAGN